MRSESLVSNFPEMRPLQKETQIELVELARYQTFVGTNANSSWAFGYVVLLGTAILIGVVSAVLLKILINPPEVVMGVVSGAIVSGVGVYSHKAWYVRKIRPAVLALLQSNKFKKSNDRP